MNNQKKILQFKLTGSIVEQLRQQGTLLIDCLKTGIDIVLNDSRVNVNVNKDSKTSVPTAVYYNNNGSNLHYLGEAVPATASVTKTEEKKPIADNNKAQIDIPRSDISPLPSTKSSNQLKLPQKKSSTTATTSNMDHKKQKPASTNIPSTPSQSVSSQPRASSTPQKTPKPSTYSPHTTKKQTSTSSASSEQKYSIKTRIIQRLALQPRSVNEIVKSIDRTQQEKCDQLEVKHILETVAIPIKRGERNKYCLKPALYKDIEIWDWPFYSSDDKLTVADNAKEAYDLMYNRGIDIDRSNLYHPDSPYKPPPSPAPKRSPPTNKKQAVKPSKKQPPELLSTSKSETSYKKSPVDTTYKKSPTEPPKKTEKKELPKKSSPPSLKSTSELPKKSPSSSKIASESHKNSPALTPSSSKVVSHKNSPALTPISLNAELHKKSPALTPSSSSKISSEPYKKSPALTPSSKASSSDTFIIPSRRSSSTLSQKSAAKLPLKTQTGKKLPSEVVKKPLPPSSSTQKLKSMPADTKKPASNVLPNVSGAKRKHNDEDDTNTSKPVAKKIASKSTQKPIISSNTPAEPVNIKTQHEFDAYCASFRKAQTEYSRIKKFFKTEYPSYIQAMESTQPPKGTKRSYYDLNVEYHSMVKETFLKNNRDKEDVLKEAEQILEDCNKKRRRLNYMWTSIKQNINDHEYKISSKYCKNA